MQSITIEQLQLVNNDLATKISQLAKFLKEENSKIKSSYWINIEISESDLYIHADNGFDISESIKVSKYDKEKILELI